MPDPGVLPEEVYAKSLDCVHCGLCLTACPTYLATGRETSSPRGRIYLMRGVAEGRIEAGALLAEEAFLCLGCRACETACPSGVQYGAMLELTRQAVDQAGLRPFWQRALERLALRWVVPKPRILHALMSLLGLAQRLRLDRLALTLLPARAREAHALLPQVPPAEQRAALPPFTPARGEKRGRVALFVGCVMPEMFGDVHRATLRVLAANGFDVVVPAQQGCCGALQAHAGDLDGARGLARKNVGAFTGEGFDAVILNSAGCGAAMRECNHWLPNGEGNTLASLVRDVAEFLDEVGLRPPGKRVAARVCYDDPCHLLHGQRVGAAPRKLLSQIVGLEMLDHAEPDACCGAAGIYNLTQPEMSAKVLARKLDALEAASPDIIATGNPGCIMQLRAGVAARAMKARVVHPIELLDAAYS